MNLKRFLNGYIKNCNDLLQSTEPNVYLKGIDNLEKKIKKEVTRKIPLSCDFLRVLLIDWQNNANIDFRVEFIMIETACAISKETLNNFIEVKKELNVLLNESQKYFFEYIFSKHLKKHRFK